MIDKYIILDTHTKWEEPSVQLISGYSIFSTSKKWIENTKLAGYSEALDYAKTIQPKEGMIITLVIGTGAYETYGPNRKGDSFPEHPIEDKVEPDQVITQHYKSYEQFGKVYRHHVNYDPEMSIGNIIKAFWNPEMHRIEIIEEFYINKAEDLASRINSGEYPAKSMGCRVKYDVCSICGNKAKTRKDYCSHLKFNMNDIDPYTGKITCAHNPSPQFFDSSWVTVPADPTGYMLAKVADLGTLMEYSLEDEIEKNKIKYAAIRLIDKISEIKKEEPGKIVDFKSLADKVPLIPPEAMEEAAQCSPGSLVKYMSEEGGPLSLLEIIPYVFKLLGIPLDNKILLRLIEKHPELMNLAKKASIDPILFSYKDKEIVRLDNILGKYIQERFPSTEDLICTNKVASDLSSLIPPQNISTLDTIKVHGVDVPYYIYYYAQQHGVLEKLTKMMKNVAIMGGGIPISIVITRMIKTEEKRRGRPLSDIEIMELINRIKEESYIQGMSKNNMSNFAYNNS